VAPAVYTVTYNGNSESSGTVPSDSNSYTVSGNVTVAGNTGTLSKTGHTFDGWCTTQPAAGAACTGTPRAVGSTFSIVADTTLYAVWALNSQTISYAAGTGGSGSAPSSPTSVAYGSTFTTPANTYSRTGHTFAGWSDGSSTYAAGATYPASGTVSGNVTLTATWTANSQTISYAAGTGGSGSAPSSPTSVSYGGTFTTPANTYSRTGHTFAGWSDGSSTYAAGATYPASGTVSGNVTLTATWAASCAQGGTCVVGDTGPGGGKVFYVAAGTFACGPALASTCKYLEAAPTTGTNAWTDNIYAWSGNTTTEIGAAAQGTSIGTGYRNTEAMVAQSSTAERAGTITRAYRGPNNLTDWYLPSRDELNELYTQRTSLGIASTGEYWSSTEPFSATSARYIWFFNGTQLTTAKSTSLIVRPIRAFGLPPFSVTYNGNTHGSGSVPTDSSTYSFNASVTVASNSGSLAKSGYTFGGWCTTQPAAGSACSGTSRAAGSTFSITSNVTLYAVWTTLTCAQGGTCVVGDTGPGGGVVFYVAGSNFTSTGSDCGTTCRYLEAAPSDQSTGTQWCSNNSTTLFVTAAAIGTGMANTNTARETCASGAIHIAADYSNAAAIDWHLPSRLELNELCKYARQQTTGDTSVSCNNSGSLRAGFASSSYWSSSENSGTRSWSRSFGDGVQGDNPKTSTYRVRPIRAF
jgi:uncharacterized repeat protein (TIGR02543 family)